MRLSKETEAVDAWPRDVRDNKIDRRRYKKLEYVEERIDAFFTPPAAQVSKHLQPQGGKRRQPSRLQLVHGRRGTAEAHCAERQVRDGLKPNGSRRQRRRHIPRLQTTKPYRNEDAIPQERAQGKTRIPRKGKHPAEPR